MARLLSLKKVNSNSAIDEDEMAAGMGLRTLPLDLQNIEIVTIWCRHYAISAEALKVAAQAVGLMPAALIAHFASRGASTKKLVTPEMRAARMGRKTAKDA